MPFGGNVGQTTPNIGIYIPAAGETNYDASFAAGMVNIDQHDHSGGPNKGVPIASSGLADGSVTFNKLNSNVADVSTGIGTNPSVPNQLQILGLLKNIFQLATTAGFISKDGVLAHARTITGTAGKITVTNGDGVSGNPVITLDAAVVTTNVVGTANQVAVSTAAGTSTVSLTNPIWIGGVSFDGGGNVLSDYVTAGTWTPVLTFGGASTGITYSVQGGRYTRIGNVVFYQIQISLTSKGSSTGSASITGLPITTGVIINRNSINMNLITLDVNYTSIFTETVASSTQMKVYEQGSGQSVFNIDDTYFANNSVLFGNGFYIIGS